ncbi:AtpZ/AtpI family protein [Desulfofustis glycolicus]|uniref:ATP synthase protein I n=1 Tax=Desulfofustis glycolicus DSM 9705 TaxID=1121409 RepID=A0A1M5SIY9_9BACT|nr:AtpZ/AtpI family protein [Desulfofustis glycolicus]MCB2215780.1 AtpZ/AtpI family protein [Desulfobulbaceae bacterium]SHH38547.1 ATP synthase protein I [Desulfofustis glycolicus DSM 9705]
MAEKRTEEKSREKHRSLLHLIDSKQERKLRARRNSGGDVWFGLGMFGLVGWSVAVPTLLGIALGVWLDGKLEDRFSWTLMCLVAGVVLGCLNAWFWVQREGRHD